MRLLLVPIAAVLCFVVIAAHAEAAASRDKLGEKADEPESIPLPAGWLGFTARSLPAGRRRAYYWTVGIGLGLMFVILAVSSRAQG